MSPAELVIAAAQEVADWTAPEDRYLSLVAPWEMANGERAEALQVAAVSDCALVAMGILRRAGLAYLNPARYVFGSAFTLLIGAATKAGAYERRPASVTPGDVLHLGAVGWHVEHVGTVVSPSWRVDGGQRTAEGRETILKLERHYYGVNGALVELESGRPVIGAIHPEKMAAFYGGQGN